VSAADGRLCWLILSDSDCGWLLAVVLLLQATQKWREEHEGKLPSSYKERSAFKELLNSMRRRGEEGVPSDVRPSAHGPHACQLPVAEGASLGWTPVLLVCCRWLLLHSGSTKKKTPHTSHANHRVVPHT
jgi:hypothetical protein